MRTLMLALLVPLAWGQQFEVASVRPADRLNPQEAITGRTGTRITAGQVTFRYRSLRDLIALAYSVEPYQVVEDQALAAGAFDIQAKLPDGASKAQVPAMLRSLLEERFQLRAHREMREDSVYLLKQASGGHKLAPGLTEAPQPADPADGFEMPLSIRTPGMKVKAFGAKPADGMQRQWDRLTMAQLATHISPLVGRPVLDQTGLSGNYQVTIDVSLQDILQAAVSSGNMAPSVLASASGVASDPASASIFSSVKRLGLTLDRGRGAVEMVIVDSVRKTPTEN